MEFSISLLKKACITFGPKLLFGLSALILGLWAIEIGCALVEKLLKRARFAGALRPFMIGLLGLTLKTLLGVNVLGILGFETTSFIALLGSAGLAIGMSLSGTLNNLAGGIVLLNTRQFKLGDLIEAQGQKGRVREIQIFNTILTTTDNKTVSLANGALASGTIVNYSTQPTRRINLKINVDYENDLKKVKRVLLKVANTDEKVLPDPAPQAVVCELAESHVVMMIRVWVESSQYVSTTFALNEAIKNAFDDEEIICHSCPLEWKK